MKVTWHLIRKDFCRLRWLLGLFTLLVAGKIAFYAWIAGLFSVSDLELLRRMQNGPEMLLRFLAEPVFAYVLVGWLVFEDSPVEQDAHWITRPISGGQLFAAKFLGAGLALVVWPLLLNLGWWLACGVGTAEILRSAGEFAGLNIALVALGLACASLTGDFPRFVLWSLIGVVLFGMLELAFTLLGGPGAGLDRLLITLAGGTIFGTVVAGHQFITRRWRRSLGWVAVGLGVVLVAGSAWRGNRERVPGQPAAPEVAAAMKMQLTGAARYRLMARRPHVELPVRLDGVPEGSAVAGLRLRGDWIFGGVKAWTSQAGLSRPSLWNEAIRRRLGLPAPAEPDGQVEVQLPFSVAMARRAAREPGVLHVEADVELGRGAILAELPLREGRAGAYAIAHVSTGPFEERRNGMPLPSQQAVSLLLTEISARGLQENSSMRTIATHHALLHRRTGRFFLPDNTRSGPEAITVLNQAKVNSWRLTYLVGPDPVKPGEWSLVLLRFDRRETLHLATRAAPIDFAADSVPPAEEAPAVPARSLEPPAPKAVVVSPEMLAAYAGRYELRPDFVITIKLEHGQLVASAPEVETALLVPESVTKFAAPAAGAAVEFVRDAQGAVTHLVLTGGERERTARRLP